MPYKVKYTFNKKPGISARTFKTKKKAEEAIALVKKRAKKGRYKEHYSNYKNFRVVKK